MCIWRKKLYRRRYDSEQRSYKCSGVWLLIVGLSVAWVSLYAAVYFHWSCLTECFLGLSMCAVGIYMIFLYEERTNELQSEPPSTYSNRESPLYYELEVIVSPRRSLPPIPVDAGSDFLPILDKAQ